ncbi:Cof-type HAD-IIB family hydrolase [Acidisoma cladoniae]|jgi:Cof subfamily protein (haloacid dehalogenase superfamily)|uniref:Cof-type HAD-IIB family hydrolase n=1 Tax=Acidisoma cladoniae TaxID=3040935 RepID=UPI0025519767|nr:Cof-type HAD-IIB family hydrolase [Acidisoma sp. PAMC 29798]
MSGYTGTTPIRLVVSDIDGTLVRHDKTLHPETIKAAQELRDAGIVLCLVSSRPPRGMKMYLEALGLKTPHAGFNGGETVGADEQILDQLVIPGDAARTAVAHMTAAGLDVWVFAGDGWYVKGGDGPYVAHEAEVTRNTFTVVDDFEPYLDSTNKIMSSSKEFDRVARVEAELQGLMGEVASVNRSSPYYVDVTNVDANKGHAALALARIIGVSPEAMCCLGDMNVDVPMLKVAGLSVAMGNAADSVKAAAMVVTGTNDESGWADAIRTYVLPKAP